MATLLQKYVGANEWDAEDTVGRLGLLMHAAFIAVGFHPYGATPASGHLLTTTSAGEAAGSSRRLSRYYTLPELAHREGADAAVLLLCARDGGDTGGGGDVALLAFLTTERHLLGGGVYRERLDLAAAAPLLSRSLRGAEPWASRACWALAGGVCWGLRVELCRRNGLPSPTGLMSLPDDVKAEILRRLCDGADLARVECTCTQLRRLLAERDAELWKPLYEARRLRRRRRLLRARRWWYPFFLFGSSSSSGDESAPEEEEAAVVSWKLKYVQARPRRIRHLRLLSYLDWLKDFEDPLEEEEEKVSTSAVGAGVHRRKGERNEFKKKHRHGAGAIHSPSSRYRWKNR